MVRISKVKSEKFSTQQVPQEQSRRSPAGENVLPLKELLLDNKHYDSEKLMIYWLPCDSLLIESEGSHIFGPFFTRRYTDTLVVSSFYLFCNTFANVKSTSTMAQIRQIFPLIMTQYSS